MLALPRLVDGHDRSGAPLHNRIRCRACRRMVPMYVDRGDGQPLRRHPWSATDPRSEQADPSLEMGACVMADEALPVCPFCGYAGEGPHGQRWGESAKIRARLGPGPCGIDCWEATGTDCKCSCGGRNHGIL